MAKDWLRPSLLLHRHTFVNVRHPPISLQESLKFESGLERSGHIHVGNREFSFSGLALLTFTWHVAVLSLGIYRPVPISSLPRTVTLILEPTHQWDDGHFLPPRSECCLARGPPATW